MMTAPATKAREAAQIKAPRPPDLFGGAEFRLLGSSDFVEGFIPADYIVDGILRRGWLYTFTAPTGHGKTALTMRLAMAIATGQPILDVAVAQGSVLYLAGENPDDVRSRWIASLEEQNLDAADVPAYFTDGVFSIRNNLPKIIATLEAAGIELTLVVVDTLAAYFDGADPNSNSDQQEFATMVLRALTRLPGRPTVIVPAHPVKGAQRSNLVPMGGSALLNQVDGNLTAWLKGEVVTLSWQGKFRGAPFEHLQFELAPTTSDRLVDAKGRHMPTVLAKPLTMARSMKLATEAEKQENRMLELVAANPLITQRVLATQIGMSKSKAGRLQKELLDRHWLKREGRGLVLTDEGKGVIA